MKLYIFLIYSIFILLSCNKIDSHDELIERKKRSKVTVITTLFPLYDFSKKIGKEKVEAKLLLSPGQEPHTFEPSPKDISKIVNCDIFIYTGKYMEPWAERIISSSKSRDTYVVDASRKVFLEITKSHEDRDNYTQDEHHHHETEHHHGDKDPHIWLDPIYAKIIVDSILESFIKVDPQNRAFYISNATKLKKDLDSLHEDFLDLSKHVQLKTIYFSGHFAFNYLVKRYDLKFQSSYHGFSPDAEPSPKSIGKLVKTLKNKKIKYIFYEPLVEPKIAKILSEETGAKMLLLHNVHNLTKEEMEKGFSYISIMRNNIKNLKLGLNYQN